MFSTLVSVQILLFSGALGMEMVHRDLMRLHIALVCFFASCIYLYPPVHCSVIWEGTVVRTVKKYQLA